MTTQRADTREGERPDAQDWLDQYGDRLFAYALIRVRERSLAEDLVQDTFVAALQARDRFQGAASVETWLVSILRHKIVDHIRRASRTQSVDENQLEALAIRQTFDERGIWRENVHPWPADPTDPVEQAEFWHIFDQCREKLPPPLADVFTLRELDQLNTDEICKTLNISATNLSVRLHRARLLLRKCLERNWFSRGDPHPSD